MLGTSPLKIPHPPPPANTPAPVSLSLVTQGCMQCSLNPPEEEAASCSLSKLTIWEPQTEILWEQNGVTVSGLQLGQGWSLSVGLGWGRCFSAALSVLCLVASDSL